MIYQEIDVNGYWKIIVVYNVFLGEINSGFTQTDFDKKLSIVGISKANSSKEFINTIVHEAKHVQSAICKYYNVSEDGEDAAYLIGFIVQRMYEKIKFYLSTKK